MATKYAGYIYDSNKKLIKKGELTYDSGTGKYTLLDDLPTINQGDTDVVRIMTLCPSRTFADGMSPYITIESSKGWSSGFLTATKANFTVIDGSDETTYQSAYFDLNVIGATYHAGVHMFVMGWLGNGSRDNLELSKYTVEDGINDYENIETDTYQNIYNSIIGTWQEYADRLIAIESYLGGSFDYVNGQTSANYIKYNQDYDLGDLPIGATAWDDTAKTTVTRISTNVYLQNGQELLFRARNTTGETIANGKPVYVYQELGSSGKALIDLASNTNYENSIRIIGVATENISNNSEGFICVGGKVRDLSGLTAGAIYYLGANGTLTTTRPIPDTTTKAIVAVGIAENSTTLIVDPRIHYKITDSSDVHVESLANENLLLYNGTNERFENISKANFLLAVTNRLTQNESDISELQTAVGLRELLSNKATDFTTINDTLYPSVKAVKDQLDLKEDIANKGAINGYAPLVNGKVPASYMLDSYDDYQEVATYADLIALENPVEGVLYVVINDETSGDNASSYRYTGTVFVKISEVLSPSELKTLYESNANTNAFTDALLTKLTDLYAKATLDGLLDEKADLTYVNAAIDSLKAIYGWESSDLTPTSLENTDTLALSAVADYDMLLLIARVTADDTVFTQKIPVSELTNGTVIEFFNNANINATVDATNITFNDVGTTETLKIYGVKMEQQLAENISLSDDRDVDTVVLENEANIKTSQLKNKEQDKRLADVEETARKIASGESKETVSDTEIVSLPKNCANGQVIPTLNGLTLQSEQLVSNGDFSDGTTGWTALNSSNTVSDGILSNTGDGTSASSRFYQTTTIELSTDMKLYAVAKQRVTNAVANDFKLVLRNTLFSGIGDIAVVNSPNENQWYQNSGIITIPLANDGQTALIEIRHLYADAATANGKVMEVDYAYAFNISTLIANKQYSPLYEDTFDNLSDSEIKAQMDLWVSRGTLPNDNILSMQGSKRLKAVGKNLFDKNVRTLDVGIDVNEGDTFPSSTYDITDYIRVKPNTTYNFTDRRYGAEYDVNKNYIGGISPNLGETTITTSSNAYYIRWTVLKTLVDTYQIEQGTTATTYEPYTSTEMFVEGDELQGIGDVADTIEFRNGKAYQVKRFGVDYNDVLQSATFAESSTTGTTYHRYFYDLGTTLDFKKPINNDTAVLAMLVIGNDIYTRIDINSINDTVEIDANPFTFATSENLIYIVSDEADAAAFNAALAVNDVTFIYELATPIETELTSTGQLLGSSKGTIYIYDHINRVKQYTTNITVDTAIDELVKVVKLNNDGSQTSLDIDDATVAGDGLSFTHTSLSSGDFVYIVYKYLAPNSVAGLTDILYYNSDLVRLSPDGTAFKLDWSVDNAGAITWSTTEVE